MNAESAITATYVDECCNHSCKGIRTVAMTSKSLMHPVQRSDKSCYGVDPIEMAEMLQQDMLESTTHLSGTLKLELHVCGQLPVAQY